MKQIWTGDSGRTVTLPIKYPAHNPQGLGWKKHGKDGRFMKKPDVEMYFNSLSMWAWIILFGMWVYMYWKIR